MYWLLCLEGPGGFEHDAFWYDGEPGRETQHERVATLSQSTSDHASAPHQSGQTGAWTPHRTSDEPDQKYLPRPCVGRCLGLMPGAFCLDVPSPLCGLLSLLAFQVKPACLIIPSMVSFQWATNVSEAGANRAASSCCWDRIPLPLVTIPAPSLSALCCDVLGVLDKGLRSETCGDRGEKGTARDTGRGERPFFDTEQLSSVRVAGLYVETSLSGCFGASGSFRFAWAESAAPGTTRGRGCRFCLPCVGPDEHVQCQVICK